VKHWPKSLPNAHREILIDIIRKLSARPNLVGLAIGGSFVSGQMDDFSDLDLKVVADPKEWDVVNEKRRQIAESIGPLLIAFTGEHIGIPQMLVCLYGEIPIHVDLDFMVPDQLISRSEDPRILWDRNNVLHDALSNGSACPSAVDWQWIEDRFWLWIHYATTKVGRGELFAAIGFLSFIREKVLGPIVLEMAGAKPYGVRHIEMVAARYATLMESTVTTYDRAAIVNAIQQTTNLYQLFRKETSPRTMTINEKAEEVVIRYLANTAEHISRMTAEQIVAVDP
jgi:hypothetical protein